VGLDDATAVGAMTAAWATPWAVAGAAHLPAAVAGRIHLGEALGAGRSLTLLRLEGVAPSVAHRKGSLTAAMQPFGEVQSSDDIVSRNFWRAIPHVMPFAAAGGAGGRAGWRLGTTPPPGGGLARAHDPPGAGRGRWTRGALRRCSMTGPGGCYG